MQITIARDGDETIIGAVGVEMSNQHSTSKS